MFIERRRRVKRSRLREAVLCISVALGLVTSACGGAGFAREDAIMSLQTTGATEVEATCMADTLLALDQLDAADPRQALTDATRGALVSASARCIRAQVLPASVTAPSAGANSERDALRSQEVARGVEQGTPGGNSGDTASAAERRALAIAVLVGFGRSVENATCVVEQLELAQAEYVFEDPNFGLGTEAFEATAFASCI